jgi:signal transduction histidine kinase
LATVKQAVQMMDGTVWVESTVGVGSIFYVKLRTGGASAA